MNRVLLSLVVIAIGASCADPADFVLPLPKKLHTKQLTPDRQKLLRAEIEAKGLIAKTELAFDETYENVSGQFVVTVEEEKSVAVVVRVFGRFDALSEEVLLGRAEKKFTFAPRTETRVEFADGDWAVGGAAIYDVNGNNETNADDLANGFDPAPSERTLDVAPDDVQFPSGIRAGEFQRQVIVVENVSDLAQEITPSVIGGQGISLVRIDATGEPTAGAPRELPAFLLEPFQEVLLAVTFAPSNAFLVRGSVAIRTLQKGSNVRSFAEVPLIANADGDPQPVPATYDAGTLAGSAIGFDGDVLEYPPAFLFGGQPISPGTPTKDGLVVPALGLATSDVAGIPANVVLLLQVPPRHRLSAVLSGLEDNAQLALAVLDGDAIAADSVQTSTSPGTAPEAVQLRNSSLTDALRVILVVGRVDQRETKSDTVEDVPFSLLAQIAAGPEFNGQAPISRSSGDFRGGNDVVLTGTGFEPGATVRFGTHTADPVRTIVDEAAGTIATVTPPADAQDIGDALTVVVTNPDGQAATLPLAFTYDPPAPLVDAITPPTASTLGVTPVTITGAFFDDNAEVLFGGVAALAVDVVSANRIDCIAPAAAPGFTTVVVQNFTVDGTALPSVAFPFVYVEPAGDPPSITDVTLANGGAAEGPLAGGTLITITGANFTDDSTVRIGGSPAASVSANANGTVIACRTPQGFEQGAADVVVTNPDGQVSDPPGTFTYVVLPPNVTGVNPDFASQLGGTRLFVSGTDFTAPMSATFEQADLSFPAPLELVSSSLVIVTSPLGLDAGPADLVLLNAVGDASAPVTIVIQPPAASPPRILSLSPDTIRTDEVGTQINVTGTDFDTDQFQFVLFVDDVQTDVTNLTATGFRFSAPAHAEGAAIVRVLNGDGQTDADALIYLSPLSPTFLAVTPDAVGALVPGDVVTVTGANLVPGLSDADIALVRDDNGAQLACELAAESTSTQVRVLIRDPLPSDETFHIEATFAGFPDPVVSPSFAAFGPAIISASVVQGQPVDGGTFAVLVQGATLNPTRISRVSFTKNVQAPDPPEAAISFVPSVPTSSFVRVDVNGELAQGAYTVALEYDYVDANDAAQTLSVDAPGLLVVAGECGNSIVDPGEDCDPDDLTLGGNTCADVGFFGGDLGCTPTCVFDTRFCNDCGNSQIDDSEECDGPNLNGALCIDGDPNFTDGTVTCNTATCRLDFSGCSECGDGTQQLSEQCDGNDLDGASCLTLGIGANSGALACRGDCTYDTAECDACGDGRCGASEDRDCSPTFPGCAVCVADCGVACGDGTCGAGETCNNCNKDCSSTCNPPFTLSLVSGGGQSGAPTSDLTQPFVVHVQDATGAALPGLQIVFTAPPGGSVAPATAFTDAVGNASSLGTMPRTPGAAGFVASGSGPDATLLAGAPLAIASTNVVPPANTIATALNHFGSAGRTPLLDAGNNPIVVAATKTLVNFDASGASGIVVAPDGTVFLSDTTNHRVLAIDPAGAVRHVAGRSDGNLGAAVESVPALTAALNTPRGLALDAAGNLYIVDTGNARVRKVAASNGIITTVAGGGASTADNVLATTAQLSSPASVLVNAANELFIVNDNGAQHVRKVSASGIISTVITQTSCGTATGPKLFDVEQTQLAFDAQGRLLVLGQPSNSGGCPIIGNVDNLVRLEADGSLSHVAGGNQVVTTGAAKGAALTDATGLAVDPAGNIYVSERNGTNAHRIRRITPLGVISTVIGTGVSGNTGDGGPASSARLANPGFLAFVGDDLWMVDHVNHNVRVVNDIAELTPPTVNVTLLNDGQTATVNQALPAALGVHVEDSSGNPVAGVSLSFIAQPGAAAEPTAAATDASGNATFVGFVGRAPGSYTFTVAGIGNDGLPLPGSPFTLNATATDTTTGVIANVLNQTSAVGFTASGGAASRTKVNLDTQYGGVAIDPDDDTMYVADTNNHRVLRVDPSGLVTQIAGTGVSGRGGNGPGLTIPLSFPRGLALDEDKNLYIADSNNDYVRVLLGADQSCGPNGCQLNIFAGNNLNDASPADGVVATGANLNDPTTVAVHPDGDLFIIDASHNRVRRVAVAAPGVPGTISSPIFSQQCNAAGVRISSFSSAGLAFDLGGHLYVAGNVSNAGGCPLPDPNGQYVFRLEDDGSLTAVAGGNVERTTGAALGTDLDTPSGLAVDPAGNLYIAEQSGHRIRMVDVLGRMSVIAGDGTSGLAGDGTLATGSRLASPSALAISSGRDLYVWDGGNNAVREIRSIGSNVMRSAHVVIDSGDAQSIFLAQNTTLPLRVRVLEDVTDTPIAALPVSFTSQNPGDSVFAPLTATDVTGFAQTSVRIGRGIGSVHDVTVGATTWLESITLGGIPLVFTINGVHPDPLATVAVVNTFGIAAVVPANGSGQTIPAVDGRASLDGSGIAIAPDGTLVFADSNNHRVMQVSPEGAYSVLAGSGTPGFLDSDALSARFNSPRGVAIDAAGNVYVADSSNDRVRRIDTAGNVSTIAGGNPSDPAQHGDGNDGAVVNFSFPDQLTIGPDGALYVVDSGHDNIRRIVVSPFSITTPITGVGCTNAVLRPSLFTTGGGMAFDASGRIVFTAQVQNVGGCTAAPTNTDLIMRGDQLPSGTVTSFTFIAGSATVSNTADGIAANNSRLTSVHGIVVDPVDGDVYFFEGTSSHRLRRIAAANPSALITTVLGTFNTAGFSAFTAPGAGLVNNPDFVIRDPGNGDFYFTEDGSQSVRLFVP